MGLLKKTLALIPDEQFLKIKFFYKMHKKLNLENPTTYNEKIQWLKLYDRNPDYVKMVDKYEVKSYVSSVIGAEYVIPTLGVWDNTNAIDFDKLPNQFVLKCTHDSGGIVICKDKSNLPIDEVRKSLSVSLEQDYYALGREWPYKQVKPRIIAEEYMEDSLTGELRDYKFFVFDGTVKAMFIASDRQKKEDTKFDFFDRDFNYLDLRQGHPNSINPPAKPINYDLMIKLAEKLGDKLTHVRVDFYEVNGKVFFGELTFFHHGGWTPFDPPEWDYTFGNWLKLPNKFNQ